MGNAGKEQEEEGDAICLHDGEGIKRSRIINGYQRKMGGRKGVRKRIGMVGNRMEGEERSQGEPKRLEHTTRGR